MALYLDIEWKDGHVERIPAINREAVEVPKYHSLMNYVESITPIQKYIAGRDDLDERRYWAVSDIKRAIINTHEGDRIRVVTEPKSYGDVEGVVHRNELEQVRFADHIAISEYYGEYGQGEGQPWLRTDDGYDSRGMIEEIEIISLAGDDDE